MITIVHIIPSLNKGGAERFVVDLCNESSKRSDVKIYLLALASSDESSFLTELDQNVTYVSFNKASGFQLSVFLKLTLFLRKLSPDIINTHLQTFEYLSLFRVLPNKTRFIHTIHSDANKECPFYIIKKIREFLYTFGKVLPITISKESSASFQKYYKLNSDVLIYNGRSVLNKTERFNEVKNKYFTDANCLYAIHVGRITEAKNQKLLVDSFLALNDSCHSTKFKLYLIGDIQDETIYSDLKASIGVSKDIEILDSKFNIVDYLLLADVFCLSSFYEGMPISLIEAMSVGCIPISTAVGGIPEMIEDGKTGFLSKDLSKESYVETIQRFLCTESKEEIKIRCIQEYYDKYNIAKTSNAYLDLYKKSLKL